MNDVCVSGVFMNNQRALASAGDIPTGMVSRAACFSQHMLLLASDIVPQVQTLERESKAHGCDPVLLSSPTEVGVGSDGKIFARTFSTATHLFLLHPPGQEFP